MLMKKILLLLLLLTVHVAAWAQYELKGRVVDENTNEPLGFVSIYLNTTTRGTATNEKGAFALAVPAGKYEVVVSFLGYEPIIYPIDTENLPGSVLFKLRLKENKLGMVEVKGKRDEMWYRNLEVFKESFLGTSALAGTCKLLNPEVLSIQFDAATSVLTVSAEVPLIIENAGLGYKIEYLLTNFEYRAKESYISFVGYPKYELAEGGKGKQRRWVKNREASFNGSLMHFFRALQNKRLEEEGFNLRRLYRTPNPERPSEEEITAARAYLREQSLQGNYITIKSKGNSPLLTRADSVGDIISRAGLPKVVEQLDINPVPYSEYLSFDGGYARLAFKGYFQVVYTGEKEEAAYIRYRRGGSITPSYQTSVISLTTDAVYLEKNGSTANPLDVFLEGYWGWEKMAEMLPLDYGL
ncbi:hypothetical protein C1N53_16110 [Pontibacter sp. SGAir0037]|nr:hypothetical protein C1N53_16110 [Pontibacter sp. SGAir0037]